MSPRRAPMVAEKPLKRTVAKTAPRKPAKRAPRPVVPPVDTFVRRAPRAITPKRVMPAATPRKGQPQVTTAVATSPFAKMKVYDENAWVPTPKPIDPKIHALVEDIRTTGKPRTIDVEDWTTEDMRKFNAELDVIKRHVPEFAGVRWYRQSGQLGDTGRKALQLRLSFPGKEE